MLVANTAKNIAVSRTRQGKASFAASYNLNSFSIRRTSRFYLSYAPCEPVGEVVGAALQLGSNSVDELPQRDTQYTKN